MACEHIRFRKVPERAKLNHFFRKSRKLRCIVEPHVDNAGDLGTAQEFEELAGGLFFEADSRYFHCRILSVLSGICSMLCPKRAA